MNNTLRDGIGRVDGRELLRALTYIAKDGSATTEEVAKHLKISTFTAFRLFRHSRKQFGVKITYRKTNSLTAALESLSSRIGVWAIDGG